MEFLKEILGEDLYNQVAEKLEGNESIKLANIADGSYVTKETYDTDVAKAKADGIEEGKASVDMTEIETLKGEKEQLEKDFNSFKFNSALELKLLASGAKNPKALKGLIDESKLTFEDGVLNGFDEQLEVIKTENDYLFGTGVAGGLKHDSDPKGLTKEEFDKMGYQDKLKVYNETPELYNELAK